MLREILIGLAIFAALMMVLFFYTYYFDKPMWYKHALSHMLTCRMTGHEDCPGPMYRELIQSWKRMKVFSGLTIVAISDPFMMNVVHPDAPSGSEKVSIVVRAVGFTLADTDSTPGGDIDRVIAGVAYFDRYEKVVGVVSAVGVPKTESAGRARAVADLAIAAVPK